MLKPALQSPPRALSACEALPFAHAARNDTKERMRCRLSWSNVIAIPRRRAPLEFAAKMLPLVEELAPGLGDGPDNTSRCYDTSRVERVAACGGFGSDGTEITGDAGPRIGGRLKTLELRVPGVAAGATKKDRLREKSFAPECNQAGGVEMARVKGPETHEIVQARQEPQRCLTNFRSEHAAIEQVSNRSLATKP